jgi:hypothetical protein
VGEEVAVIKGCKRSAKNRQTQKAFKHKTPSDTEGHRRPYNAIKRRRQDELAIANKVLGEGGTDAEER